MIDLAIVIPIYNEESNIASLLDEWIESLRDFDNFQFILVNDGSRDQSLSIIKEYQKKVENIILIDKNNAGHGNAIFDGYMRALKLNAKFIFQCDSDNQIPASEFNKIWKKREFDFILGVRENRADPLYRIFISKNLLNFVSWIFQHEFIDLNSPFRLIKREVLEDVVTFMNPVPFAPNIFMTILAMKKYKCTSVSVLHVERSHGVNSLNIKNLLSPIIKTIMSLLRLKLRLEK